MTQTYDLILTGGTVVNQDGEGVRDVGVIGGTIVAIGDLSRASAGERVDTCGDKAISAPPNCLLR